MCATLIVHGGSNFLARCSTPSRMSKGCFQVLCERGRLARGAVGHREETRERHLVGDGLGNNPLAHQGNRRLGAARVS